MDKPIETFVTAVLVSAVKKQASHVRLQSTPDGGRLQMWIDGAWHDEEVMPRAVLTQVLRRLCAMIGLLFPKRGDTHLGSVVFELHDKRHCFLIAVRHDESIGALIEIVDEEALLTRSEPIPPTAHPFRN